MNQNICLCYRPDKGLYVENCDECADAIFSVYNTIGYKTYPIDLPDENVKICIESNFKYGSRSYLFARMKFNGKSLLDFDKRKIYVLNNCSITNFSASVENWGELFLKIISAYNKRTSNACPSAAITYINELITTLRSSEVDVRSNLSNERPVKWSTPFLITLLVGDKIVDLLNGLYEAVIVDENLTGRILELCELFLQNLKSIDINLADIRTVRVAEALNYICQFMNNNGARLEFLKYFHGVKPKN